MLCGSLIASIDPKKLLESEQKKKKKFFQHLLFLCNAGNDFDKIIFYRADIKTK